MASQRALRRYSVKRICQKSRVQGWIWVTRSFARRRLLAPTPSASSAGPDPVRAASQCALHVAGYRKFFLGCYNSARVPSVASVRGGLADRALPMHDMTRS